MTSKTRSFRLSPALVLACVALFVALTGSAIAAGVGKNTVRSPQIVDGTIRTIDLRDNAVAPAKTSPPTRSTRTRDRRKRRRLAPTWRRTRSPRPTWAPPRSPPRRSPTSP